MSCTMSNHAPQHEMMMTSVQSYFDPDGDKELRASHSNDDSQHQVLTWRGDPNETCSDCTIVVVTSELQTSTYHVHKSVLCFGTRQSKYFSKVLLNSVDTRKKKNRNQIPTAKVELDQRDAENFPTLLDFIYAAGFHCSSSSNGTVITAASTLSSPTLMTIGTDDDYIQQATCEDIKTDNAVSLRYMAKRFQVEAMVLVVNRFIQKDLNFKTGPTYLCRAAEYQDERLLHSAQRLCAENFEHISLKAILKLPHHLFRIVIKSLESFEQDNRELSYYLSEVVCRYLEKHPKALSAGLLLELTDPLLMPYIASEAAIGYTALIKVLDAGDVKNHWGGLVSFSRRCAKSVVQEYGWSDFSVQAAVDEYLGNTNKENGGASPSDKPNSHHKFSVDSLLFATSFAAALDQAQDDHEEILIEQERMEKMINQLADTVNLLEKNNLQKDQHLAKQQMAIDEARKQIISMKEQMGRTRAKERSCSPFRTPVSMDEAMSLTATVSSNSPMQLVDLVSPSQVGADVHEKKNQRIRELRTKNEMRARSIIS